MVRKVRIKFFKKGPLKFISHLDLDRTFKSVLMRSGVKIEFSHGFNPRPILVFSQPLPLGVESETEFLEIKAESEVSTEEIKNRLNACLPPDMQIVSVIEPTDTLKDAVSAKYEYTFISPDIDETTAEKIKTLFSSPVIVEKRSKKSDTGFIDFDIAPFVKDLTAEYDGKTLRLTLDLPVIAEEYVNPEYVVRAVEKYAGITLDDPNTSVYNTRKLEVYKADGKLFM